MAYHKPRIIYVAYDVDGYEVATLIEQPRVSSEQLKINHPGWRIMLKFQEYKIGQETKRRLLRIEMRT